MKSYQVAEFGAPLQLAEREAPQPEGTQVRLRVRAAGVCHSDLHIWEGGYDLGHGKRLSLQGDAEATIVLTRVAGEGRALLVERVR